VNIPILFLFSLSFLLSPGGARVFCFIVPAGNWHQKSDRNWVRVGKMESQRAFLPFSFLFSLSIFDSPFEMGYGFLEGKEIWGSFFFVVCYCWD
jgi:hypothetical protein